MNHYYFLKFVRQFSILYDLFFSFVFGLCLYLSLSLCRLHIFIFQTMTQWPFAYCVHVFIFTFSAFFFFLPAFVDFGGQILLLWTVYALFTHCAYTIHVLKNIKNGSHDTIYTFKNYFAIVFSVFSNNKFNSNTPNILKLNISFSVQLKNK